MSGKKDRQYFGNNLKYIWIDFHYFWHDHLNTPSNWKTRK